MQKLNVLDHGYVELIETWGTGRAGAPNPSTGFQEQDNEVGIVEAARQSTQGGFRGWDYDARLLKYLHDHRHATPFEFAGMVLEVQAPIFVFREWHRHRTQSYNEMSARYAPLPDLYYTPTVERVMMDTGKNKQAQGVAPLTHDTAGFFVSRHLKQAYELCEEIYQAALASGIPKELARAVMPVGHYSRMRASANLRNWLAFLTLRMDPNAQWEIRQYAKAVGACVKEQFPRTWELFAEREGHL